jgi:Flp pilus assembly protein TadD
MDQQDVYAMLLRGRDLLGRGHHHQAATVLERASLLEPAKTSIREELARVVELDPSNDYAHFGLGLCHAAAGNRKRALGHLKIAVAMRPDSEDYQHALARLAG